jgi:hypothetical protein
MTKNFQAFLRGGVAPIVLMATGAIGAALIITPASAQDVTAGVLSGQVVDATGKPVADATVLVKLADRNFATTAKTAANGSFTVPGLAVGSYDVTVTASAGTTRTPDVAVQLGGNNYTFTLGNPAGASKEIVVVGTAIKKVDFSGMASGAVFNVQKAAEQLPVARNITAIQMLTPQVTAGDTAFGGVSIGGSSVAENIFYVNGMNITNFRTFVGGTTVPFEFYDQVQVKTGGYQAEFGRNTGGAVIALTRSGSNTFHGGFSAYYAPNSLRDTAPDTYAQKNSLDKRTQAESNVWLSGPIIKDRLFFFAFYNPRHFTTQDTNISDTKTVTSKTDPFWGGKLDLNLFEGHRVEATYFNDSQNTLTDTYVGASHSTTTDYSGGKNYIFKYTGAFTNWFTLSALYGRSEYNQTSLGTDDLTPYVVNGRSGTALYFAGNPNGTIETGNDKRTNYRIDADFNFSLLGQHRVRAGWDLEKLQAIDTTMYSGGVYYRYYHAGASGALSGLIPANTDYVRVRRLNSGGQFASENTALYIQDSWDVNDRLNLSIGLRNDKFVNKDALGVPFTTLSNQWGPRLGVNFDPTGTKTARISAFYGRYYLPVAANTNIRLAGSETFTQDWYTLPTTGGVYTGSMTSPTLGTMVQHDVLSNGAAVDASTLVSKNIKPQYMDEFMLGGEYTLPNRIKLSANLSYRRLGAVLEDVDFDGSGAYGSIIKAYCATQTKSWCSSSAVPSIGSSGYVLMNPGTDLIVNVADSAGALHEITIPASSIGMPKASRNVWALELKFDKPFNGTYSLSGSYVWGSAKGNYEGGVKSDNGQDDTGLTQDFDESGWMTKSYGYLPNHRAHTFKLYGNWKPAQRWNIGFNAMLQSPRKYGCIGTYPLSDGRAATTSAASWYCNAQIAAGNLSGTLNTPIGRGAAFESDWYKTLDLTFAYTLPIETPGGGGITMRADIFNVFNFKSALQFREIGDLDSAGVIDPNYRKPTVYQTPRYVRFSITGKF